MSEIQVRLFFCQLLFVVLFYAIAVVGSFFRLKKIGLSEGNFFEAFALAGFCWHTGSLAIAAFNMGRLPLGNAYELMIAVAWAMMFAGVLAYPFLKLRVAPTLLTLTVIVLTVLPLFCPAFSAGMMKESAVTVNYAFIHAMLAIAAYALLGVSFIFALMYVLQMRSLKHRGRDALSRSLLPLPKLFSFEKFFLAMACAAMAISLIIGAVAAVGLEMNVAYLIKFSIGALLFALMLGLLLFSLKKDFDSAAFSKLIVLLFIFAVLLIVPISIRSL